MINAFKKKSKLLTAVLALAFTVNIYSDTELTEGFDWRLPAYAERSTNGGMLGESFYNDPDVPGAVLLVLWKESQPTPEQFNFNRLEQSLANLKGRPALIRLEVNSRCHAPDWVTAAHSSTQSFKFWQDEYLEQLRGFVTEFANRYKDHEQVIGVHLGVADGEYYQYDASTKTLLSNCPEVVANPAHTDEEAADSAFVKLVYGGGRDGWGEFNWLNTEAKNEQATYEAGDDGLTPQVFKRSVKKIIDMYHNAFGAENAGKLVWMGFAPFGGDEYRDSIDSIYRYVKRKKLGKREGQIEAWMRYTGNIYGVDLVSELAPGVTNDDGDNAERSCSMTFNERFADRIEGRYWGDENEFYGDPRNFENGVVKDENADQYIVGEVGPFHNQPYRFYMSSMRALQLRKNYLSIRHRGLNYLRENYDGYEYEYTPHEEKDLPYLQTKYNSASFITYLSKTLGRTRTDTPDAFIVLGEKTINTQRVQYPVEYKNNVNNELCLEPANDRQYALVSDFGRWLSVVSKTEADPTMKKVMPDFEKNWGQIMSKNRNGVHYELYARKASEIHVDINNRLMRERCRGTCDIQVKVVFKDDGPVEGGVNRALQVVATNGVESDILTTMGGGQTRTASFDLKHFSRASKNNPDFYIKTLDGSDLSVLMIRVNFISDNGSPNPPLIISPKDGNAVTEKRRVVLSWAEVPGAAKYQVSYHNAGKDRTSNYKKSSNLCQLGICEHVVRNLKSGDSTWKVRSKNAAGESDWSTEANFTVQ